MITLIKLYLYKILTQGIIILGRLREKLNMKTVIRNDRVFVDPQELRFFICCDCGLSHVIDPHDKFNLVRPVRAEGYDYTWRKFSDNESPFKSEQEAIESMIIDSYADETWG